MRRPGLAWLLLIALVSFALVAAWVLKSQIAPRPEPDSGQRFAHWQSVHLQQVAAYLAFLKSKGVADVLPQEVGTWPLQPDAGPPRYRWIPHLGL